MFSFLQLNIYLFLILILKAATEGTINRNIIYDEVDVGKKLKGGKGVNTFQHMTKISCALSCSRDESCHSFTFCGRKVCYLNSENVLNEMSLVDTPSCQSYFDKKGTQEKTEFKQTLETTSAPITQSPDISCFPSSKGNGLKCIEINDFGRWYKCFDGQMEWAEARYFCEDINGVLLFSKTWSSEDSIDDSMHLLHPLGYNTIWVGIRRGGDGELLDAHDGLRSNGTVEDYADQCYCLVLRDYHGSELCDCLAKFPFICELNSPLE